MAIDIAGKHAVFEVLDRSVAEARTEFDQGNDRAATERLLVGVESLAAILKNARRAPVDDGDRPLIITSNDDGKG